MTDWGFSKKGLFSLKSLRHIGRFPNKERLFSSSGGLSGSFLPNICDFFRACESKIEMDFPTANRGECGLPVDSRRPKRLKMELKNPFFGGEGRRALFRLWVLGLCCLFTPGAVAYMGDVCLSPLEQMALFSGTGGGSDKKSYKSQIRQIKSHIRSVEKGIERYKDKLDKATDNLANSLNSKKLQQPSEEAAQEIADYMAGEQNSWNCRKEKSGSVFLHLPPSAFPSGPKGLWSSPFFSGVFGPALPLILTSAPAFADLYLSVEQPSLRTAAVMFTRNQTPKNTGNCEKVGGDWREGSSERESSTCNMDGVWKKCAQYENTGLGYRGVSATGQCVCRNNVLCEDEKKARRKREAARDRLVDKMPVCKKKFPKLQVTGIKGGKCQCRWSGPGKAKNLPCTEVRKIRRDNQSQKDAMETCRKIYEPAIKVTRVVPSRKGPECYCGKMKCADKLAGTRKTRKCKKYEGQGYTEFKDGRCMCGNIRCDIKERNQKQRQEDFKQCKETFPGKKVQRSARESGGRTLVCYCLNNGKTDLCKNVDQSKATPLPPAPVSGEDVEEELIFSATIQGTTDPALHEASPDPKPKDSRPVCKPWQKSDWFGRKGRVRDKPFCKEFASDVKACEKDGFKDIRNALKRLKKYKKRLEELEDSLSEAEDLQMEARFADEDEEDETEAAGLCIQCLKDVRKITGPGPWKRVGDGLSVALGAGLSAFGLYEARRAQNATNELLALQGFPAENNFGYNLAGLSVGWPLVAKGLYGMTHGDNVNCNRSASPYAHAYPSYPMF